MERYERLWERLVTLLSTLGEVEEQPGRLVLTIDGRSVEVVMTEREWDELVSIPHGSFASAAATALAAVLSTIGQELPFVVYGTYALHPSDVPTLPDELAETTRRIEEYKRAHPDAKFGWFAYPPDRDGSQ